MNTRSGISVIWATTGGKNAPTDRLTFARAPSIVWLLLLLLGCWTSPYFIFASIHTFLNLTKTTIHGLLSGNPYDLPGNNPAIMEAKLMPIYVLVGVVVLCAIWTYYLRRSLEKSKISGLVTSAGLAGSYWLFPPAGRFKCYRLILQSYRASSPDVTYASREWQKKPVPALLYFWMGVGIAGFCLIIPLGILFYFFSVGRILSIVTGGMALGWGLLTLSWILTPVVAIVIQQRLSARYRQQHQAAPASVASGPPVPAAPVSTPAAPPATQAPSTPSTPPTADPGDPMDLSDLE